MEQWPVKVYIAGPMTGIPQFNIPAFDRLAADLRKQVAGAGPGKAFEPINPAEMDGPDVRAELLKSEHGDPADYPFGMKWVDFLTRDLQFITSGSLDAIVVLPGWERSKGARLETFVGHLEGLKIVKPEYSQTGWHVSLWEIPRAERLLAWDGLEEVARAY